MLSDEAKVELAKKVAGVDGDVSSCEAVFWFFFGKNNVENWRAKMGVLAAMLGLMILAAVVDIATGGEFHHNGIYPRRTDGLFGIVLAPFLHRSISQLIINAVPFVILGTLVLMREEGLRVFGTLNVLIIFGAGLVVWMIGEDRVHVGSYAFVFGYFGYLLLFSALVREWRSTVIAVCAFLVYGTTIISMFSKAVGNNPDVTSEQPTSWLYMLSGLGAGLFGASLEYKLVRTGSSPLHRLLAKLSFGTIPIPSGKAETGSADEKASLKGSSADDEA